MLKDQPSYLLTDVQVQTEHLKCLLSRFDLHQKVRVYLLGLYSTWGPMAVGKSSLGLHGDRMGESFRTGTIAALVTNPLGPLSLEVMKGLVSMVSSSISA